MALKRILILIAFIFELLAAVGFGEFHLGTVTLSLVAAGLAAYFLSRSLDDPVRTGVHEPRSAR